MIAKLSTRIAVGIGAGALLLGSAVLPAQADPAPGVFGQLVGLGSDTTQDVLNGLAAVGDGVLASYNATGTGTVTTQAGGPAIPRANGSSQGRDLLRAAIGQSDSYTQSSTTYTTSQVAGQVHFARSSSGTTHVDGGVLAYIPFGIDAVTYAVSSTSKIPLDLTKAQLASIYKDQIDRVAYDGTTSQLLNKGAAVPAGTTAVEITPFIPQAGSGTRSFWLAQVGITEAELTANAYPKIKATDLNGQPVQEHKGAALNSGTAEQQKATIVPFSIGQWVAQANGKVENARAGALLGAVEGVAATTGSGTSYVTNPAFAAYVRDVYNIVPSVLADDPTSLIAQTFVGASSLVCQKSDVITSYGFKLHAQCGNTNLRAYAASASTIEATIPATAKVGVASTLSATVASNGDQGGVVEFYNGSAVVATATIAKGQTTGSVQWTPAAPGQVSLEAVFVPTLAGVAASEAAPVNVTVAAADVPAPASTTTTLKVSAKPTVGKTITATATITKPAVAGTVTFRDGAKVLGKPVSISASAKTAQVKFKATKRKYALTATFVPAGTTALGSNSGRAVNVTAAKAKATVKLGKAKVKKRTATIAVRVNVSGVKATGKLTAKVGKKVVGRATVKNGKATLKVKSLRKGKNKVTVAYAGSTLVGKASASRTVSTR